ncbi:MAG: polysaccharide biosynthesis tyrosine autokinase [Nostocaceae cyanobacterium]|nr:polysaccharide biosynthesis tyrosine autokinase [Nostocaceae cyanobacterium]
MVDTSIFQKQSPTELSKKDATNIKQISQIIQRRRWLIVGISCTIMSLTGLMAFSTKPIYKSSIQMMISSNLSQGETDSKVTKLKLKDIDFSSQKKLMLSGKLLKQAVDLLRSQYPNLTVEDIKSNKVGKPQALNITRVENGNVGNQNFAQVFEVYFQDEDPVKVQKVLQTLAQVYEEYNKKQQQDRVNQGLSFVNNLLPSIQKQVREAEQKLEKFRQRNNFLDPQVQSKILLESLAEVQKQLQTTRAQIQDLQARYNNLKEKLPSSPQKSLIAFRLSQSSRYKTLVNEIQKSELALAQARKRYTDDAPAIKQLLQERQTQINLLREEVKQALGEEASESIMSGKTLVAQGQLGTGEIKLVQDLIEIQTTIIGLIANEKSLIKSEQKLHTELKKYPQLIAEYNRLLPEVETRRQTLEQLLQKQQSVALNIAQSGFDWQVLDVPQQISLGSDRRLFYLLSTVLLAPILGIAVALIWELCDEVIYSARDLQKLTEHQFLGTVNKLKIGVRQQKLSSLPFVGRKILGASKLNAITSLGCNESLDMVYQNIQILNSKLPLKSLMLTSAKPGEGKSTLALGLALSASRMHQRVLVIDANLHHPHLHTILELDNEWGMSLLLLDETNNSWEEYIQPIHPAIDILTAGPLPEDSAKLLTSPRMQELISMFEKTYDLILIDVPPILDTVDGRIMAPLCNGTILVGRIGQVTKTEITQATEILSGLNLIGIVANDANSSIKAY